MAKNNRIPWPVRLLSLLLTFCLLLGNLAGVPVVGAETNPDTVAQETIPETTGATVPDSDTETTPKTTETTPATTPAITPETTPETTSQIQSDPNADLETAADWEATLPQTFTEKWGQDLLAVVSSQLGYRESARNFILEADGVTQAGYNRYGAWYGGFTMDEEQAYRPWNVTFLFFAIYYSGISDFPLEETCPEWIDSLDFYELYRTPDAYTPAAGDLVFVDTNDDGEADRVGVVNATNGTVVTAIEGDAEGAVAAVIYNLEVTQPEDPEEPRIPVILGYADMEEAQKQVEDAYTDPVPINNTTFTIYFGAPQNWTGYTIKANVCQSNGENRWQSVDMTNTGKTQVVNGTTYYVYSASVTEIYCGFDQIQFQRYSGSEWKEQYIAASSWTTKETIEGKLYVNGSGWVTYSPDSGGGDNTNPATPTVYFSVPTDWTNTGRTIKVFAQYGSESSEQCVRTMTDTGLKDAEGRKIYRYTFSESDCPYGGFYRIYFQAFNGSTWAAEYKAIDSTTTWTTAATVDGRHYKPGSGWGPYSPVGTGDTNNVVDIASTTFNPVDDVMYVNSTFYDYYTDYELNGNNRDGSPGFSVNHDNWVPFRKFNTALSNYYSGSSTTIPLYVGHFQPEWDDYGWRFCDAGLPLYGYKDGKAYYSNGSMDQKYFMSVNNSVMNSASNVSGDRSFYAAQGLVQSTLGSEGPLAVGSNVTLPFFSRSFLAGSNSTGSRLGYVYENVSFPFTKQDVHNDGVEYWVFDSAKTTVEMKRDSATGNYFLEAKDHRQSWSQNLNSGGGTVGTYGFFPFNSGANSGNANTYNYGFGCRLDIPFRLTDDGTVLDQNGKKVPIIFDFSGDDDVWVFIDGQLVLDIGGCHGRVYGKINFRDGTAYVEKTKINPGTQNTGSEGAKTTNFTLQGANTDEHTLTMFYMERGMWESNMMITFNFPDENQLEVEKQVDTSNVNELFDGVFDDQSMFTFNIKNLATHFAEVNALGTSYDKINLNVAGSSVTSYPGNVFSKDGATVHWYAQYEDASSQYRHKRYGLLTLPTPVDISNMTKLSFEIFVEGSDSFSLSHMYLQLLDKDVDASQLVGISLTSGDAHALGCIGSYLSGKTYGSTNTSGGQWVTVTLDLSKLDVGPSFNETCVKFLRFGYDEPRNIYLRNFQFLPAAVQGEHIGFITQQYDVPSYGSANSGVLMNATNAVYTTTANSSSHVVDANGNFVLQNGETVNFHDQFRRGSYIRLEEVLSTQEKELFTTTWTMYENGTAVSGFGIGDTVTNPYRTPSMVNVRANIVTDSRVERVTTGAPDGSHELKNAYTSAVNPGGFVFRSFADPDSTDLTTKLKVVFTNTVNVASLTIAKEDAMASSTNANHKINPNQEFTFVVNFYNVGGLGLENQTISTTIKLKVGQSYTISGIPLNTQYTVYELKEDANITLDRVYGDHTTYTEGAVNGRAVDAYRVAGILEEDRDVTFVNIKKPVITLQVEKKWLDENGDPLADSETPTTIYLRLQRNLNGTGGWSTVSGYENVAFTPGYGPWTYTFSNLDLYKDHTAANLEMWNYRVLELDADGKVIYAPSGSITIDGKDYGVTYSIPTVNSSQTVFTETITNKLQSKISVHVEKVWAVTDGVTIPSWITVQLQRRTGTNAFTAVQNASLYTGKWQHTFTDLDSKDGSGNVYEYRVVELDRSGAALVPGTGSVQTTIDGKTYIVTSTSAVDASDSKRTNWVITNTLIPTVTIQITKRSSGDPNQVLPGATFVLNKTGLTNAIGTKTTGSDGIITFSGLLEGKYTLTELEAPEGYSLLSSPIEIHIFRKLGDDGVITYTGSVINHDGVTLGTIGSDGVYTLALDVYNNRTIEMPHTGGVHGFEFWILGGLCVTALPLLFLLIFPCKRKGKYIRK